MVPLVQKPKCQKWKSGKVEKPIFLLFWKQVRQGNISCTSENLSMPQDGVKLHGKSA
jgi:hypothetical protein